MSMKNVHGSFYKKRCVSILQLCIFVERTKDLVYIFGFVYKQNIEMRLLQAERENFPKIIQKMWEIVWKNIHEGNLVIWTKNHKINF